MAYRKDTTKQAVVLIRLRSALASPEMILERSHGEVLEAGDNQLSYDTSQRETVCSVNEFSVR